MRASASQPIQQSIDDVPLPLRLGTFVVVDLETTGTSPTTGAMITEIGAVKIRGGQVLGEFHTLVNPGSPIPPFITVLTGITDAMVAPKFKITTRKPFLLVTTNCSSDLP